MDLYPYLFEEKDPPEKPFGNILFGQERELPTEDNPEPNTKKEKSLVFDLERHYHGQMGELSRWIDQLLSLKDEGEYLDVLEVPRQYQYAYRVVAIKDSDLASLLGVDEIPPFTAPNKVVKHPTGTVYRTWGARKHFSWTVNTEVFLRILDDWWEFPKHDRYKGRDFLVFFRAPIKGNTFIMNPSETEEIADQYAYQEEVISVGNVRCDGVWYCEVLPGHKDKLAVANFLKQV